ncbi:MAG: pseudouridylate synthase [Bacteroidales bacterium]|nr:pseudouridylate synthase [Bacteroidales bacterium]
MSFGMENEYDILTLIPQRPPMVMVDRLLHCDTVVTETELTVSKDNIMVEDGHMSAIGLIENVAQTCAARMGYINLTSGKEVRVGVIGALRDMTIHSLPEVGSTIKTRIEVSDEVFGMTLAQAESRCGDMLLCSGTIKIALL